MPKSKVNDPLTDQEIAFAHLVLSGAMTDRQAAEAVRLNPDSAAYTKAKPRVRDYMLEHRAAVQQQLVQQEADLSRLPRLAVGRAVDGLHRLNPDREQVLNRLWELAKLSPEMTRNSMTGQVKALSMIIAMQDFIPDRRAVSAEKKSAPPPVNAQIYQSAWLRKQQAATTTAQPLPPPRKKLGQCPRLSRRAVEARTRSRPGGRGASGPRPQSARLRPSRSPRGRRAALCPPVHFCSRHQSSFLY